ncbi:hypothetical protein, partial [Mesorhizobium sp.]|uniref:hypothetical protein n=1 Tax=Mesorhizobium sp. TaxID=1871066 RepID=UPI00257D4A01
PHTFLSGRAMNPVAWLRAGKVAGSIHGFPPLIRLHLVEEYCRFWLAGFWGLTGKWPTRDVLMR